MSKILIIDDDADFTKSLRMLLEGYDYATVEASDGDHGLTMARTEKPDLVLLDVMMTTDSEGFEVARRLKEDPEMSRIPVILLTGIRKAKSLPFSFEPDADWLPVKAVLEKPFKPDQLLKIIHESLKSR